MKSDDFFFCSFCGQDQRKVKKLIAGPKVYICDSCIEFFNEILEDEKLREDRHSEPDYCIYDAVNGSFTQQRCNFCGKERQSVKGLLSGPYANICHDCVELCSNIIHKAKDDEPILHRITDKISNKKVLLDILTKIKALETLKPTALIDLKWHLEDTICWIEQRTGKERAVIEFDDNIPDIPA